MFVPRRCATRLTIYNVHIGDFKPSDFDSRDPLTTAANSTRRIPVVMTRLQHRVIAALRDD